MVYKNCDDALWKVSYCIDNNGNDYALCDRITTAGVVEHLEFPLSNCETSEEVYRYIDTTKDKIKKRKVKTKRDKNQLQIIKEYIKAQVYRNMNPLLEHQRKIYGTLPDTYKTEYERLYINFGEEHFKITWVKQFPY